MRQILLYITLIVAPMSAISQISDDKLVLTWSDEFNGKGAPDQSKWKQEEYNRRNNDNGPDGWWDKDDAYMDGDGNLVVRVRKIENRNNDDDAYDYSVGAVRSKGIFEQKYGKFECRMKLPTQPGWWVAFWMMLGDVGNVGNEGVDGSEVDIMEGWGWTERINHAIHWDGYGSAHKIDSKDTVIEGLSEGFHTYTLEWTPDSYTFFIDGAMTWQTTGGGICHQPGYVKITGEISTEPWAIGSNWSNKPNNAAYPDSMMIDYVRVYQITDFTETKEPFSGSPVSLPGIIEAENYDKGGEGISYHDGEAINKLGEYRTDGVDIEVCSEGGYNIGWIENGEWLEYTVNVTQSGKYAFSVNTSSKSDGGEASLLIDDEVIANNISIPVTEDWQIFEDVVVKDIQLEAGEHVLRFKSKSAGYNLNKITVTAQTEINETIQLYKGWNLIGCPHDGSTEIETALSSIWDKVVIVKDFDGFYDSSSSPALNSLQDVKWGKGYYVKVSEDCILKW